MGRPSSDPIWFVLGALGLAVAFIGLFLPEADSTSFATIAQNTMLQHGGWKIAIGILIGFVGLYRRWQNPREGSLGLLILGAIGVAYAVAIAKNVFGDLTLCTIINGVQNPSDCVTGSAGTGIYALGIGSGMVAVAAANLAGWLGGTRRADALDEVA